jgi:hypothetical protein
MTGRALTLSLAKTQKRLTLAIQLAKMTAAGNRSGAKAFTE